MPLPPNEKQDFDSRLCIVPAGERPQERFQSLGVRGLSDTEVLALIIRSGTRGRNVLVLAAEIMARAGSLSELRRWHETEFRRLRGIGRVKAIQLVAIMDVFRRISEQAQGEAPLLNRSDVIAAHMESAAYGLEVEKFWVLCLNRRNRLRRGVEVSSGTATATLVHPREVFRSAIREGAASVACVHNHPSGDPSPSRLLKNPL